MISRRDLLTKTAAAVTLALSMPLSVRADETAPLRVTVSLLPMQAMVEAIGGPHVTATVMVPPNVHPRTFEPSPMQMAALESSDIYIAMGVPHERNWMPQVKAARPDMPVLNFIEHVQTRTITGRSGANAGGEMPDPHIWMGPKQLRTMAAVLRDALIELRPESTDDFKANTAAWLARLDAADADAKARLAPYKGRAFLVYHPAFGYLGDAYGLRQMAIEEQGMEPGPRRIAATIEAARDQEIGTIFVQGGYSEDEARTIAAEIGADVVPLPTLPEELIGNLTFLTTLIEASFR
ncbi:zinc ABC transporter substrate-binding protein [Aquicoccus sp. SU-CL01552]